jgi:hypothetical protein
MLHYDIFFSFNRPQKLKYVVYIKKNVVFKRCWTYTGFNL